MWKKFIESKFSEAVMALIVIITCVWAVASYYQHKDDVVGYEDAGSSYAKAGIADEALPRATDAKIWLFANAFAQVVYPTDQEILPRIVLIEELASRMQYGQTVNDYINLRSYSQTRLSQKFSSMSVSRADELGRDCRGETECAITAWADLIELYRGNAQFIAGSR